MAGHVTPTLPSSISSLWPHEVVYNNDESPTEFDTLSMPQFVQGFTILTRRAKPSIAKSMTLVLGEMMEDASYTHGQVSRFVMPSSCNKLIGATTPEHLR